MKTLPKFKARPYNSVYSFISNALTSARQPDINQLHELIAYDDGHYRAIFNKAYFSQTEPSKSQWNTLKKRLKRMDNLAFVFKEHGTTHDGQYYYIDFGFFAD